VVLELRNEGARLRRSDGVYRWFLFRSEAYHGGGDGMGSGCGIAWGFGRL
jgi:hypothetical protein